MFESVMPSYGDAKEGSGVRAIGCTLPLDHSDR